MENDVILLLLTIGGFLLGGIMFSRLIPMLVCKKDIAELGSDHNPGASNVFLTCGVPLGLVCLLLDMLKGFLPVYLAIDHADPRSPIFIAVLIAPVLGHAIAPFNHFNGGKCIATAFGVMIALLPITRIGLLLAGLYIFFSVVIKIKPNRNRSMLTFALFGIISGIWLLITGKRTISAGCVVISAIVFLRHTRFFSTVNDDIEKSEKSAAAKENAAVCAVGAAGGASAFDTSAPGITEEEQETAGFDGGMGHAV